MKALKVIGRYRAPHRLAISFDFAFIAAICGAASIFALSYVIALLFESRLCTPSFRLSYCPLLLLDSLRQITNTSRGFVRFLSEKGQKSSDIY